MNDPLTVQKMSRYVASGRLLSNSIFFHDTCVRINSSGLSGHGWQADFVEVEKILVIFGSGIKST